MTRQMNPQSAAWLRRVCRDVEPQAVGDLLENPPRAAVALVEGEEVEALPVRARWEDDAHFFAVCAEVAPDLRGREIVLVCDDAPYWFQL
jgi:hypothetical protein